MKLRGINLGQAISQPTQADIVFCIDATASMQPCLNAVLANIASLTQGLAMAATVDLRIRLIAYRDLTDDSNTPWIETSFTSSIESFRAELAAVKPSMVLSSLPESTLDAMYRAFKSEWRTRKTHKTVIVLTDDDTHPTLHPITYKYPDNGVSRVIQELRTLKHALFAIVAPKFPLYEQIVQSAFGTTRQVIPTWVEYGNHKGLATVNWADLLLLIGKQVSTSSVVVLDEEEW